MISGMFDGEPKPHIYQKKALGASEFDSVHGGCQFFKGNLQMSIGCTKKPTVDYDMGLYNPILLGMIGCIFFWNRTIWSPRFDPWENLGKIGSPKNICRFMERLLENWNPSLGWIRYGATCRNHPMKRQLVENHIYKPGMFG